MNEYLGNRFQQKGMVMAAAAAKLPVVSSAKSLKEKKFKCLRNTRTMSIGGDL